jgi:glutamate 5-kinase
MSSNLQWREKLCAVRRVVVKIGSRVLVQRNGRPDLRRLRELTRDLAGLRKRGIDVIVVSSGAIGSGMQALGMKRRPTAIAELQMAAAVGQSRLMAIYEELFERERCRIGQVLLTHADLKDRTRHLNARSTLQAMLARAIIPIINENDVVAVEEIKFGDNDLLAALVALLVSADLLVLLTTVDGFRAPAGGERTRRVACLNGLNDATLALAKGKGSELSTGGMASKLRAADMVAKVGAPVVIANGRAPHIISRILAGADVGTLLTAASQSDEAGRGAFKRWLAYFQKPAGVLTIDEGAAQALEQKGSSLLPIGVRMVAGEFETDAVVDIRVANGRLIARGLVEHTSAILRLIAGHSTEELPALLGSEGPEVAVHRDKLVLLKS